jgi:hypothetical protein
MFFSIKRASLLRQSVWRKKGFAVLTKKVQKLYFCGATKTAHLQDAKIGKFHGCRDFDPE